MVNQNQPPARGADSPERFADLHGIEASFKRLMDGPPVRMDEHRSTTPKKKGGVYVLVERDRPIYVGRTRDLRRRLNDHLSSSVGKAALAVKMARRTTGLSATYKKEHSAIHLHVTNEAFRAAFNGARERIGAMHVRWVVEEDDVRQALLEICAAVELKTPYNSFRTS